MLVELLAAASFVSCAVEAVEAPPTVAADSPQSLSQELAQLTPQPQPLPSALGPALPDVEAMQQASPSHPASPRPSRSISPRRLVFDGLDVDAPAAGAQDALGVALHTPPRNAGQCTPPPPANSESARRRFKTFADKITKPRPPPLLPLPVEDTTYGRFTSPYLPSRSRRIAAQSISHIPASKRGEYLIMKRMGLISGAQHPSASDVQAFEEMISSDSNEEALQLLFPPDCVVGPRKRRGRRRAV
jgi:hypothetical protein